MSGYDFFKDVRNSKKKKKEETHQKVDTGSIKTMTAEEREAERERQRREASMGLNFEDGGVACKKKKYFSKLKDMLKKK